MKTSWSSALLFVLAGFVLLGISSTPATALERANVPHHVVLRSGGHDLYLRLLNISLAKDHAGGHAAPPEPWVFEGVGSASDQPIPLGEGSSSSLQGFSLSAEALRTEAENLDRQPARHKWRLDVAREQGVFSHAPEKVADLSCHTLTGPHYSDSILHSHRRCSSTFDVDNDITLVCGGRC